MSTAEQYRNDAQQRLLQLISLLAGHELIGLAPSSIARALNCTASATTRDLANLQSAGWAEKTPDTGNWRLSPMVIQLAQRHLQAMDAAERRLREINERYSRQG